MSEVEPSKSHATRWIVGVVLAVVLYLGSAAPVMMCFSKYELGLVHFKMPPRWFNLAERSAGIFYTPAYWVWNQPALLEIHGKWALFWWGEDFPFVEIVPPQRVETQ